MLQAMEQPAAAHAPSPNSPSFAGLLAALAAPAAKRPSAWNDDQLAGDVATLSYESALRTHARYHSASPTDQSLTGPFSPEVDPETIHAPDRFPTGTPIARQEITSAGPAASSPPTSRPRANTPPETTHFPLGRDLKCASITIRLSEAECAQLRQRAAEAGLTVSAYLRSCTFEAESLRALVRETMAQLRAATTAAARPAVSDPQRRASLLKSGLFRSWLLKLAACLTGLSGARQRNQSTARA
jgi:hypothetical protein